MKSVFGLAILFLAFTSIGSAQMKMSGAEPTEQDKTAVIPSDSYLKRGAPIGTAKKASLAKVMKDPEKFAGKTILVEGVVVRSCTMQGCWAELAAAKGSPSVRVIMKDHAFFIPLQSAGAMARAEGVLTVKKLSKAEVDHMIEEDGAKFANRNVDGSVTEVSFEATGVELTKGK